MEQMDLVGQPHSQRGKFWVGVKGDSPIFLSEIVKSVIPGDTNTPKMLLVFLQVADGYINNNLYLAW